MLLNTFIISEFVEILYSSPTWPCVEMCHTVQRPVPRTWQCVIWYHDQCLAPGNVSYDTTSSASHLPMCHTLPRPVPFIWQCVLRYHDQCLSPGNMSYYDQRLSHGTKVESSTPSSDEVYFFSDLGKLCDFLRIQLLKDDIKLLLIFKSENKNGNLYKTRECYRC